MTTRRQPLMDISNQDVTSSPGATGTRRKSGRAVKAPQKFIPDAPSSQLDRTSASRKRGRDDLENDASELDADSDASEDTVESAGEEVLNALRKKARSSRKPAVKKPKVNGKSSYGGGATTTLPTRTKAKKVLIADKKAGGLYADIFTSGSSSEDVADRFMTRFFDNGPAALTDLINMVLKSMGCNLEIVEDDVHDQDHVSGKLEDIQEEFNAQSGPEYPLISKAKSSLDFREALTDFFVQLILVMYQREALVAEHALMENIHAWIATMSSSNARAFRHTATLIGLTITNALCSVAAKDSNVAADSRRQLQSERKSKGANKARLANFQEKITTSENRSEYIRERIQEYFETIYVNRYRDVDWKIRKECVGGLGNWIITLPSVFFEGSYLRYMGWMLNDLEAHVRQEVLTQLHQLMDKESNYNQMRHFIERFKSRIIEMATSDSVAEVRASAVHLVDLIRKAEFLDPSDIDKIGKLIYDSEPSVRKSVAGFFMQGVEEVYSATLMELGEEEELTEFLSANEGDLESPRKAWIKLKALTEVLSSYDAEDQEAMPSQIGKTSSTDFLDLMPVDSRFTLAAQVLYEKMPEIKEWEMLANYLLYDHSVKSSGPKLRKAIRASFKLTDLEEIILLEILNSVVRSSLTEANTSNSKKKPGKREIPKIVESTARRLADLIPKLLKKFGANPRTAQLVLRLEHVLDLGIFQDLRQDSTTYAKLLDEISTQFSGHADRTVLNEAGAALLHARAHEELDEVTDIKIQTLWEDTIHALRTIASKGEVSVRGALKESLLVNLSHHLARLGQLTSISNCVEQMESDSGGRDPPINILLNIVARGVFEEEDPAIDLLEDEVVLSAIRSAMFYFMWKVKSWSEAISKGREISPTDVDNVQELQDTFITNLIASLSSRANIDKFRLSTTGTLLDVYILFSTLRPGNYSKTKQVAATSDPQYENLRSLFIHEIKPEVQAELTSIFDLTEKHYAKKAKKKLAEPLEDDAPEDLDEEHDDEEDEGALDIEKLSETLRAEQQLCELASKLIFAILAKVMDTSGSMKGKLTARLQRNRSRLGNNFKEVVAYLDEPKEKKRHISKAQQTTNTARTAAAKRIVTKSEEIVEDEDDEDEDGLENEPEEGDDEDLRRRELQDDDALLSAGEGSPAGAEEEDHDIMGD